MVTKEQVEKAGYTVLPKGGRIRLDPTDIPHDWYDLCANLEVDPNCKEIILCVCGVKEIGEDE